MPLPNSKIYTSKDYWNLPDGERAELIDGNFFPMAMPNTIHQELVGALSVSIVNYMKANPTAHDLIMSPFAVNLTADDKTWIEPDIVICDKSKLSERACESTPEFLIEIVLPTSRKMDYITKTYLYSNAGVREYWIVDPEKRCTTIYYFDKDFAPVIVPFDMEISGQVLNGLNINISELLK